MIRLLTGSEAKAADALTISCGMPSEVLMERAALAVVREMEESGMPLDQLLVLAGTGNNGGDGIAVARLLCERGLRPAVLLVGDPNRRSAEMQHQLDVLSWYEPVFVTQYKAGQYTVVVDALFGVGLSREITGFARELIGQVNADPAVRTVAVDIPSGIHADSGRVCGAAIRAERTVSFAYGKPGLYLALGAGCAGEVRVAEIGVPQPERLRDRAGQGELAFSERYLLEETDIRLLPLREAYGNKGTYGKVLVIAGSEEICGAASLAARAALTAGAGMVRILTSERNRIPLAASLPEALISTYDKDGFDEVRLAPLLDWADGVLIGPGIGTGANAKRLLALVLARFSGPTVLDADALNLLAAYPHELPTPGNGCVVTPHLMEMSRLTGLTVQELRADPFRAAEAYAADTGAVCVMKDARTVIACPDGTSYLTASGSSALATAGSGDVLAGVIAALVTAYPEEKRAAALGDLIHALAGRTAGEAASERAVKASDVIGFLHKYL